MAAEAVPPPETEAPAAPAPAQEETTAPGTDNNTTNDVADAKPAEAEATAEDKPAEGDAKPVEGDTANDKPAEGDASGEAKPVEGDAPAEEKPAEGDAKPAEGEEKPAEGDTKPAEGDEKPAEDKLAEEGDAKPDGEAKPEGDAKPDGEAKPEGDAAAEGESKPAEGEVKAEGDEKPAEDKPAEDKPAEDKPAEDKPAEEGDIKPAEGDAKPAEGDEKPAEGDAKPAEEGDAKPEGDVKPADGEDKPADDKPAEGDTKPAEGDAKPEGEGESKPAEGDAKPEGEGESKPAEGEEKPAEGESKPAEGEEKPAEAEAGASEADKEAAAAIRIQALYRGHATRAEMAERKNNDVSTPESAREVLEAGIAEGNKRKVNLALEILDDGPPFDDWHAALLTAAQHGRVSLLELLLDRGFLPAVEDQSGYNVVQVAVLSDQLGIVKALAERGDALDMLVDATSYTLLHLACVVNADAIVEYLVSEKHFDASAPGGDGMTPIHIAAAAGSDKATAVLLKLRPSTLVLKTPHGTTALDLALAAEKEATPATLETEDSSAAPPSSPKEGDQEPPQARYTRTIEVLARTDLHDAVAKGDVAGIEELLANGFHVDTRTRDGTTALHAAAQANSVKSTRALKEGGIDASVVDMKGNHPLHFAAKHPKSQKLLWLLLEDNQPVDVVNKAGLTPLHIAAGAGHKKTVELLLKADADITIADTDGNTPAMLAAANEHPEVEVMLLSLHTVIRSGQASDLTTIVKDKGVDVDKRDKIGTTALHLAASLGKVKMVRTLLDLGAKCEARRTEDDATALIIACASAHSKVALILLRAVKDVNTFAGMADSSERRAIHHAAAAGSAPVLRTLLNYGVDCNVSDNQQMTPLHHAAASGSKDAVLALVNGGARRAVTNDEGHTPIQLAEAGKHAECVTLLQPLTQAVKDGDSKLIRDILEGGIEVDTVYFEEEGGPTALVTAARYGQVKAVRVLLEHGADPGKVATDGTTPLMAAVIDYVQVDETLKRCKRKCLFILLNKGAQVDAPLPPNGSTVLEFAIQQEAYDMINALVDKGADPNTQDSYGSTSLHYAAKQPADVEVVNMLLAAHASREIADNDDMCPYDIAVRADAEDLLPILSSLHIAVGRNDVDLAESFITTFGCDVNDPDGEGFTPLHKAVQIGSLQMTQLLLEHGAETDARDTSGRTALHAAAAGEIGNRAVSRAVTPAAGLGNVAAEIVDSLVDTVFSDHTADGIAGGVVDTIFDSAYDDNTSTGIANGVVDDVVAKASEEPAKDGEQGAENETAAAESKEGEEGTDAAAAASADADEPVKEETASDVGASILSDIIDNLPVFQASEAEQVSTAILADIIKAQFDIDLAPPAADDTATKGAVADEEKPAEETATEEVAEEPKSDEYIYMRNIAYDMTHRVVNGALDTFILGVLNTTIDYAVPYDPAAFLARRGKVAVARTHSSRSRPPTATLQDLPKEKKKPRPSSISSLLVQAGIDVDALDNRCLTALHVAILEKQGEIAEFLLKNGADAAKEDTHGLSPLHMAAATNQPVIVQALLDAGALRKAESLSNETALDIAKSRGYTEVELLLSDLVGFVRDDGLDEMKKALDAGVHIDTRNDDGDTALLVACRDGRHEFVALLVERGADITHTDAKERTPLHIACELNHASVVEVLLKQEAVDVNKRDWFARTPLHIASANGFEKIVGQLLAKKDEEGETVVGVDVTDADTMTPLHHAALSGSLRVVTQLLEAGADRLKETSTGDLPWMLAWDKSFSECAKALVNLSTAVRAGNRAMVEQLLDITLIGKPGFDVDHRDTHGRTGLFHAVAAGNVNLSERMINDFDANPQAEDNERLGLIHAASITGKFDCLPFLLTKGVDINKTCAKGRTGLQYACANGHVEMAAFLLSNGALFDVPDDEGMTPLHECGRTGNSQCAELLIEAGASKSVLSSDESKPYTLALLNGHQETFAILADLHTASRFARLRELDWLLQRGADLNMRDAQGRTPVHVAAKACNRAVVEELLTHGAEVNITDHEGHLAIHDAAYGGDVDTVQTLLSRNRGRDTDTPDKHGLTPLHWACKGGKVGVAEALIQRGADVNTLDDSGNGPLHCAVHANSPRILSLLLEAGSKKLTKNDEGVAAYALAVSLDFHECAAVLLDLRAAVVNGNHEGVKALLAEGEDVNTLDDNGRAPLHEACSLGYEEIASTLMENGADLYILDNELAMPIHIASSNGRIDCVKLLVRAGLPIDVEDGNQRTPLIWAAREANSDIVEWLLDNGAEPNKADKDDNFPLHHATHHLSSESIVALLKAGARKIVTNLEGNSPYKLAVDKRNQRCASLLIDIHTAVRQNKVSQIIELLEAGEDVNLRDPQSWTPLHRACALDRRAMVTALIDHKANVTSTDNEGSTPLHVCANNNRRECAELLVEQGVDVNAVDRQGRCSLILAATNGHFSMVELLLAEGADVNLNDFSGNAALHYASKSTSYECVQAIVAAGGHKQHKNVDGSTPYQLALTRKNNTKVASVLIDLHTAVQLGKEEEVFRMLQDPNEDVNRRDDNGWTALHHATHLGAPRIAAQLIDRQAGLNEKAFDGSTPLHGACATGERECVELLLDRGANVHVVDGKKQTLLHIAAGKQDLHLVEMFLQLGVNPDAQDKDGRTALHHAAYETNTDCVELLLKHGANKGLKDSAKLTPYMIAVRKSNQECITLLADIHSAVQNGHVDEVTMLLRNGIDVNTRNDSGRTGLHTAVEHNLVHITTLLLDRRADLEATDNNGMTPLHTACENSRLECVSALLERGAEVNCLDNEMHNPAHLVCKRGNVNILQLLIQRKIDLNAADAQGYTSLHHAAQCGSAECVAALLDANVANGVKAKDGVTPYKLAYSAKHHDCAVLLADLLSAVINENREEFNLLLDNGADVDRRDDRGWTALHHSVHRGHTHFARALLDTGMDVDPRDSAGLSPLHAAALGGHVSCAEQLLNRRPTLVNARDSKRRTPLILASMHTTQVEFVDLLLVRGADPSSVSNGGLTALHYAAERGNAGVVKLLLQAGAEKSPVSDSGMTPYQLAVQRKHPRCAGLVVDLCYAIRSCSSEEIAEFVAYGAAINVADELGWTPLHEAVARGNTEVVKLLLDNDADVSPVEKVQGRVPLHIACTNGGLDCAMLLVEALAEVNVCDTASKASPLHLAVTGFHIELAIYLLEHGCDPNIQDGTGNTVLHYAVRLKRGPAVTEFIALLLQFGAQDCFNDEGTTAYGLSVLEENTQYQALLTEASLNPRPPQRQSNRRKPRPQRKSGPAHRRGGAVAFVNKNRDPSPPPQPSSGAPNPHNDYKNVGGDGSGGQSGSAANTGGQGGTSSAENDAEFANGTGWSEKQARLKLRRWIKKNMNSDAGPRDPSLWATAPIRGRHAKSHRRTAGGSLPPIRTAEGNGKGEGERQQPHTARASSSRRPKPPTSNPPASVGNGGRAPPRLKVQNFHYD